MDRRLFHPKSQGKNIAGEGRGRSTRGHKNGQESGSAAEAQDPGGRGLSDRRHATDLLVQLQSGLENVGHRILVRPLQALVCARLQRAVGHARTSGQCREHRLQPEGHH